MIRLLLIMLLLPATAFALDSTAQVSNSNSYTTTQELYEDCKSALALADKGNYRAFMHSECAVFIQGIGTGWMLMSAQIPLNMQGEFKLKNAYSCNQNKMDADKGLAEKITLGTIGYADKFVRAYEHYKFSSSDTKYDNESKNAELSSAPASLGWYRLEPYVIHTTECD